MEEELNKSLPNIGLICDCLKTENVITDIIYNVVEKFKLNEEIIILALSLLCKRSNEIFDDRLVSLLTFYSASESNENLRFIVLESLKMLNYKFFKNIPDCIFNLILDDVEDIRLEVCKILKSPGASNPSKTLKNFINLVGNSEFIKFLEIYQKNHLIQVQEESNIKLFEKEALNLFIDIQYLKKMYK